MTDGVAIDANIMAMILPEIVNSHGINYNIVIKIIEKYGIASTKKVDQEWENVCGCDFFNGWLAQLHEKGAITYVNADLNPHARKTICNKYGCSDNRDIEYIKIANVTDTKYIVSNDIHLYEPSAKRFDSKAQERIKLSRSGNLCKYLKKELKIRVGLLQHCSSDLSLL